MTHLPLEKTLRNHLETVVVEARNIAEAAAYEAVNQFHGDRINNHHLTLAEKAKAHISSEE